MGGRSGSRCRAARIGAFEPASNRRDPVEVLSEQDSTRVAELVPIKYGRMLVSAFTFYRGAAALMAMDLGSTPRTGLHAQLCGDAHLSNFGGFAAPDRRLTFSVNDFDETLPGPFEWDVKRFVTSFAVAGRDLGLSTKERGAVNLKAASSYRAAMTEFAGMRSMDLWYSRMDVDEITARYATQVTKAELKLAEKNVAKARTKDSLRAFAKLTADRRRRAADRGPATADRARRRPVHAGAGRAARVRDPLDHRPVPLDAVGRAPAPDRPLPLRRRGPQGGRRRQRGHPRLGGADGRQRRDRPAVPAAQGGRGIGARAVPRQEPVRPPRPAGGRGPAADAVGERHHARLAHDRGRPTASAATTTSASCGTGRARRWST